MPQDVRFLSLVQGPFHLNNRKLTFYELCRIRTLPEGLLIDCGRTEMQRMLGNAVPSLIAEVLAREIRRQFFDSPVRPPLRLLPPGCAGAPPPARVARLPRKYYEFIGRHEAHSGAGKGRLAIEMRAALVAAE
jgi:DNA (cytosine-5)-methyltransferase 1